MPAFGGTLTFVHYRFRNDDGSESTATWKAAEDTNTTLGIRGNTLFRMRFMFSVTSGGTVNETFSLTVSHNGATAIPVTATSSYVQGAVSSNLTDAANTTNQFPLDSGFTYVTTAGVSNNTAATTGTLSIPVNDETEVEWALVAIASQLSAGDTLVFTYAGTGNALQTMSVDDPEIVSMESADFSMLTLTPTLTITSLPSSITGLASVTGLASITI
jgi:hypothetical protein